MQIRIEGIDLPGDSCGASPDRPSGHPNIHVGVQRKRRPDELLGLTRGDAPTATWTIDCDVTASDSGWDFMGPYIEGPPGGRFIYLSWGIVERPGSFEMFRRAKLWLTDAVPETVVTAATKSGVLVGRLGLTDARGNPRCASVRPPAVEWSAG